MSHNQPGPYGQQPPPGQQPGQQPGPYGAPPPQGPPPGGPNPYAQGGTPAAPGYGYPQQPGPPGPPPPPGQPGSYAQPPHQQQPGPYPGQPPYGQTPQPPSSGSRNRTALIVVAVAAAVVLIAVTAFFTLGGSGGGDSIGEDDGTRYEVTAPQVSGDFSLVEQPEGSELTDEELAEAGIENMESVNGTYASSGFDPAAGTPPPDGTVVMGMLGMWGEIEDPETAVDGLFALAADAATEDDGAELIGTPSDYSSEEAVLKCQVARGTEPDEALGYPAEVAVCIWGDYSTLGVVHFTPVPGVPAGYDPSSGEVPEYTQPEPVALEDAAEHSRTLRTDALVPVGGSGSP